MNMRFILAIAVVAISLTVLMFSAISETKKAVVTVAELSSQGGPRDKIRLGARVAGAEISVTSQPQQTVRFRVSDPGVDSGDTIGVVYHGAMPDTLKVGRDVILEGSFAEGTFLASSLMTQCPSKYEPPKPGESQNTYGDPK